MPPRYAGYDNDLQDDDDQLPEGCLPMSKLRSIARAIKRQARYEDTGMGSMARKRLKTLAQLTRAAMAAQKATKDSSSQES